MLHERLTPLAATGCGLILLGVIVVEVGPGLLRSLKINKSPAAN